VCEGVVGRGVRGLAGELGVFDQEMLAVVFELVDAIHDFVHGIPEPGLFAQVELVVKFGILGDELLVAVIQGFADYLQLTMATEFGKFFELVEEFRLVFAEGDGFI
jgi:hypothetical protein